MSRPTKEELEHHYRAEGMRPIEIAAMYGVDRRLINNWIRGYGIKPRGMSISAKLRIELDGYVCGRPIKQQLMYKDL